MSSELPGTPRAGKYCPRCRAMTQREEPICRQCGHQFRSGVGLSNSQAPAPDPMNRTMQFVLPPLPTRASETEGFGAAAPADAAGPGPKRRAPVVLLALLLLAAATLGAAFLWRHHGRRAAAAPDNSPVGVWVTTLHGKAAASARLAFVFDAGGDGEFSWQEGGTSPRAGQTPLRWKQNPDGTLSLTLTPPPGGDPVAQTLTKIFSRPAWTWRVDRPQHQLVLGTLVFVGK